MYSLSVIIVVFFVNAVNGLKCFECTLSDPGCANPSLNNISTSDCNKSLFTVYPDYLASRLKGKDDDHFQCLVTIEKNSTHRFFTRRCALKNEKILCDVKSRNNNDLEFEQCTLCGYDYCNSSNALSINSIYSYLLSLALVFLYK